MSREPAILIGILAELLKAVPPALVVFMIWQPTTEQMATVMLFISIAIGALEKLFIRSQVAPKQDIITALNMPKGSTVSDLKEVINEQNTTT